MVSRTKAPYLYNPDNGRVMINTPKKRRVRPNLIPCMKLDASDVRDDPRVEMAREDDDMVMQNEPKLETSKFSGTVDDIIMQVEDSMDKGEIRQIGADLGLNLAKSTRLETLRQNVLDRLAQIKEAT